MSTEWVAQLHQAASECSDDLIFELIEQIPQENTPLAIALKDLAENFLFDKIMELMSIYSRQASIVRRSNQDSCLTVRSF